MSRPLMKIYEWTVIDGMEFSLRVDPKICWGLGGSGVTRPTLTINYAVTNSCAHCKRYMCSNVGINHLLPDKIMTVGTMKKAITFADNRYGLSDYDVYFTPLLGEILLHPGLTDLLEYMEQVGTVILTTSLPPGSMKQIYQAVHETNERYFNVGYVFSLCRYDSIGDLPDMHLLLDDIGFKKAYTEIRTFQQNSDVLEHVISEFGTRDYWYRLHPFNFKGKVYGNDREIEGVACYWECDADNSEIQPGTLEEDIYRVEWVEIGESNGTSDYE